MVLQKGPAPIFLNIADAYVCNMHAVCTHSLGTGTRSAYAYTLMCLQRVSLKRLTPVDFSQDKQHSLLKIWLTKSQRRYKYLIF